MISHTAVSSRESAGMRCPICLVGATEVKDSRRKADNVVRRRRHCLSCKYRFTTYESSALLPEQREVSSQQLLGRILPRLREIADLIDELDVETRL